MRNHLTSIAWVAVCAVTFTTAGCRSKSSATTDNSGSTAPTVVLNDSILADINDLLNQWEAAQSRGDVEERCIADKLSEYAALHFEHLMQTAAGGQPQEQLVAAAALGFSHNEAALPMLLRLADSQNVDIAANALMGLGVMGLQKTPSASIIDKLQHPDPNVRSKAAFVLTHILAEHDSRGALEPLITALNDQEIWVRVNALNALGVIRDQRAVQPILDTCLAHHDARVRYTAASALGDIAFKGTVLDIPADGLVATTPVPKLIELLDDENGMVREAAHWALRRITHEDIDAQRDAWSEWFAQWQLDETLKYADQKRRALLEAQAQESGR